jgi:glycosyltransferase involved in cell wall biosynthesis
MVSVAITAYNGERYIEQQLLSIIENSRIPDEIIICDDCSSDSTVDIINSIIANTSVNIQIKLYINNSNLGFNKNFEKAISLCSGDIIFLSDQDDCWFENKIQVVEGFFNNNMDAMLLIHDAYLSDRKCNLSDITYSSQIKLGSGDFNGFRTGALTAIRSEIVEFLLPFPNDFGGHDLWMHEFAIRIHSRYVISDILQKIRRHDSNASDWVYSDLSKATPKKVFLSMLATKPSNDYMSKAKNLLILRDRLNNFSKTDVYINSFCKIDLNKLDDEISFCVMRNSIVSYRVIYRIIMATYMLYKGGYTYFNGYKSYFRDILRI